MRYFVKANVGRVALIAATLILCVQIMPQSKAISAWMAAAHDADSDEQTRAAIENALVLTRDHSAVYDRMVEWALQDGDTNAARIWLYALAARDGWNDRRHGWLTELMAIDGGTPGTIALLHASAKGGYVGPGTLRQLAEQQIALLDWERARVTLTELTEADAEDGQAAFRLGILLALDDREQAVQLLNRASQFPDWSRQASAVLDALTMYASLSHADAHTNLGVTLIGLGEWAFAERVLAEALAVNAVNPTAQAYLGYARDRRERDGLPDLEAALAMSPNDPVIHYLLGQHWRLRGDDILAHDAFLRAYVLNDQNPALAVEVALSLQNMGDFSGAERWFTRAIALDPDHVAWQRALAAFYADTRFLLESDGLEYIQAASAKHPNDADIAASLGWAYHQLHDVQAAYDELNRAMRLDNNAARVRYYFGVVLEQRGDASGAADSYWYVVDTHGTHSRFGILAARALERLGYGVR